MSERRRIIIPTGDDRDRPLPTPHFDAEATMTARPVVPLSDEEAYAARQAGYAAPASAPFWKRPAVLLLVVLVAAGLGVAAGIGIGVYRSRTAAHTPAGPAQPVENTAQVPEPTPTPQARVALPPPAEEPAVGPDEEEDREPPDADEREEREERTTRDERRDRGEVKPPAAPEKRRDDAADDEAEAEQAREERRAERQRRREERRERRRREREEDGISLPREVERAGRELDRIRDIFEGRQP